jgi:phospholipase/lecithinase/hemolysin
MKQHKFFSYAAVIGLAILIGFGFGGGGSGTNSTEITAVKVMGDSLSDSGVFGSLVAGSGYGRIFSVQASAGATTSIWTERLATLVGAPQPCNFYTSTHRSPDRTLSTFTETTSCGSFAVGDGRINNRYPPGNATPYSIPAQIARAASLGKFKSSDLLLIDGGGNDAADLVEAFLDGVGSFTSVVTSTLTPVNTINTAVGNSDFETAGTLYMQALADEFYNSIKTDALDNGATHVSVLNIPAITKTPRFQMMLAGVESQSNAATRATYEAMFNVWIKAFNDRLANKFSGDSRVVVVDFYSAFLDQMTNPSQYGLTNVTDPACPANAQLGQDGLPEYNFETCTATRLSATPGKASPDWWKTYAFSDGFHPTPNGYQLMSQLVARSLTQAGWIK